MKNKYYKAAKSGNLYFFIIIAIMFMTRCEDTPDTLPVKDVELQITTYMEAHPDKYSEFLKAVIKVDLQHLFKTRGPYTLFLPTNDAMFNYYQENGIDSLSQIPTDDLKNLVYNHVVTGEVMSPDISMGSLPYPNAIGDYLVTEFREADIIVNKESVITDRDIDVNNGVIHEIDRVIDVVTWDIFEPLKNDPGYSIFTQGLEATGITDTLKIISIPYGRLDARTRYTILAVPDSVYSKEGIHSFDDLVASFDDGNGSRTSVDNGLFKYMDYHCLEGTFYISSFSTGTYYTLSRENQVNVEVRTDYRINVDPVTEEFTTFNLSHSNIPAKNGTIHQINTILPDIEPVTYKYTFRMTDFPDIKNLDCYMKEIRNFTDGQNQFAKIKWEGDYMQYYYKAGILPNDWDAINMSEDSWWLEITIPKIRRGKYKIVGGFRSGNNRADVVVYIDGIKTDGFIDLTEPGYNNVERDVVQEIEWTETKEHAFKLKTLNPGILFWVYLRFEPIP
jgi:uncharacterized surface protein with fasciclin (FAS1) repeats